MQGGSYDTIEHLTKANHIYAIAYESSAIKYIKSDGTTLIDWSEEIDFHEGYFGKAKRFLGSI